MEIHTQSQDVLETMYTGTIEFIGDRDVPKALHDRPNTRGIFILLDGVNTNFQQQRRHHTFQPHSWLPLVPWFVDAGRIYDALVTTIRRP